MSRREERSGSMRALPRSLFDVYALALPRGHGFGRRPPISAWQSDDGLAYGVITRHADTGDIGILAMRRRVDSTWTQTASVTGLSSRDEAISKLAPYLQSGHPPEPMPPNTAPRPALHDLGTREPSDLFHTLATPSHQIAAWTLNQLYVAMPNPDKNWAGDCQTGNFHTRLWEALLLASFREQGLLVTQPHLSPDFRIENRKGGAAWVEAAHSGHIRPVIPI